MASEVKVDTISEYTSANGVAIDSVTIKDGVIEATGDTAAGDNAAMGYTSAEGLILTGQGSTNDVTIKNDADADVIEIPTGTVNVTMAGTLGVTGVVSGAGFTAGSAVLTEAELELLDGLTAGTAIASKVVTTDANIDTTGQRNLTITGELDAATLDISGAVDIAGTANLDVVDIDGAVDMASTLQVDGAITGSSTITGTSFNGIPFFQGDTGSIYTHDVSGTDDTAQYNTAYGLIALDAITTGDNNVAVGYSAGSALTTGHRNVFLGQGAGTAITTGTHTIAIGNSAASGYDTETNNLAIGHVALGGSVAGGEYNVAVGNYSLDALTSGDGNTAVGFNAGSALTTGGSNTIIGRNAGLLHTTTSNSVIIGY